MIYKIENGVVIINVEPGEKFILKIGENSVLDEVLADHLDHIQQKPEQLLSDMLDLNSKNFKKNETMGILLQFLHGNVDFTKSN